SPSLAYPPAGAQPGGRATAVSGAPVSVLPTTSQGLPCGSQGETKYSGSPATGGADRAAGGAGGAARPGDVRSAAHTAGIVPGAGRALAGPPATGPPAGRRAPTSPATMAATMTAAVSGMSQPAR